MTFVRDSIPPVGDQGATSWPVAVDSRWVLLACLVVLDAWCVSLVFLSDAGRRERWLWTGIIVLCPVVGCILWYVLGPKPRLVGEAGDGD